jgi:5-methylthioribose kinase
MAGKTPSMQASSMVAAIYRNRVIHEPVRLPMSGSSDYRILDGQGAIALLQTLPEICTRLGGRRSDWRIREVGDGNLNLVFLVDGPDGTVCVKQALPYVRAAGPSWPMSLDRAFYENAYYRAVAPHVGRRIPEIYHFDPAMFCTVMEQLSPHIILRQGLIAGEQYPTVGEDMGEYVARACFFTSDFALPFERKMDALKLFAGNQALTRISVELIFADPYHASERNRHTSPQLDNIVSELRRDGLLKSAVARFGQKFLTQTEALLHGDLHSGSVMVTAGDTRVIDPEFALYGPMGFDLGAFFGNLLLNWYAQPGHSTSLDHRLAHQDWILQQARVFWETFRARFLALWSEHARGDAFPAVLWPNAEDQGHAVAAREAFLDGVFADMLGFAGCKMIRRILGFAHVIDFDWIEDADRRAACEGGALVLARTLLTQPQQFQSLRDVLDAVPRFGRVKSGRAR